MPTILRAGSYRFFFFSSNGDEPRHVHVERDDATAKLWLDPVRLARSTGFKPVEVRRIERLVERHRAHLVRSWDDYFDG